MVSVNVCVNADRDVVRDVSEVVAGVEGDRAALCTAHAEAAAP